MAARVGRGCAGRASEAGTGTTRAASAARGAVVEGLHSSGLAAEGDRERDHRETRGRRESARGEHGEHGRRESLHVKKRVLFSRDHAAYFFYLLRYTGARARTLTDLITHAVFRESYLHRLQSITAITLMTVRTSDRSGFDG